METTAAEKLLNKSTLIVVDNYNLQSWNLDTDSEDDGFIVLDFSYHDDEGYEYVYEFDGKALKEAQIDGNKITLNDIEGAIVEIQCFKLIPTKLDN